MRAVLLSSFSIIKIPVDPATLDAWEELLIRVFKPSLNTQGVQPKNPNSKPHETQGMRRPNVRSNRDPFISRQLTWTIFSSNSWSSTSLVTVAEKILGKGKSSMMVSVSYGELLNINEEVWPRTFAQANFTCIDNNILKN